jgi:hypothetical protein
MRAKPSWVALAVGLVIVFAPPPANAAVTIGSNLVAAPGAGGFECGGQVCTASHFTPPASGSAPGGLFAPGDGVVVRWRVRVGASSAPMAFRITRPGISTTRTGVGTGATVTPAVDAISTFELRHPIQAGDALGLDLAADDLANVVAPAMGAGFRTWSPRLEDGGPPRAAPGFLNSELLINADVEPDADGDGFGDESQDQCPTDASTQADCLPPETQITKGPKDKTKRRKARFEFSSTEPDSSFECALDGKVFQCVSPLTDRVGKGKHQFQVRATDAAGNVDPSPATDDWKVKKKRKKK